MITTEAMVAERPEKIGAHGRRRRWRRHGWYGRHGRHGFLIHASDGQQGWGGEPPPQTPGFF